LLVSPFSKPRNIYLYQTTFRKKKKLKLFAPFDADLFFDKIDLQFTRVEPSKVNPTIVSFRYNLLMLQCLQNYNNQLDLSLTTSILNFPQYLQKCVAMLILCLFIHEKIIISMS